MKLPVLFSFRRCPYAMRARIAIYYSKINYEHREILLKDRPEMLYKLSAKGTVPVLYLSNGNVIDESLDIMKWAISSSDPDSWFVNNKDAQLKAIELNDTDFKKWLDRYKYHDRFPDFPPDFYRKKCEQILDVYDKTLQNNQFLFDNNLSLGEMAILPFIRQFANVDIAWFNKRFVNLSDWLERLIESKLFISMMKKHAVWDTLNKGEQIAFNS